MDVTTVVLFVASLGLLVLGAEWLVRGASRLAAALGISPLVIGLTVVAYGTSAPEMAVSVKSAWAGQPDLALDNVVGSNVFNVLFILGASAIVTPLLVSSQLIRLDVPVMIGLSVLSLLPAADGSIGRLDGALLFAGAVAYTVFQVRQSRKESDAIRGEYAQEDAPERSPAAAETSARVARMYAELFSGLYRDPAQHLEKCFTQKYDEMVVVRDISFSSLCEHHMLPFMGTAHIGYLPNGKIVGLSKLARVVEDVSHRPQVQERMTEQIADLLMQSLDAKGVAVVIEAAHTCMTIRGVRKPNSLCITSAMRGRFKDNVSTRAEVLALIRGDSKA